jgi:hypothetical protein
MPVEAKLDLRAAETAKAAHPSRGEPQEQSERPADMPLTRRELLSPDWSREGVNPNTAPKDFDFRKRAGTSTVAR